MELPVELLLVLSVLSSVIVWILKLAFVDRGREVPLIVYNVALGAIALLLATMFSPISLPPLPAHDGSVIGILIAVLAYLGELVPVLAAVVGLARIIYEVLLKKVLEGLEGAIRKMVSGGSDIG